jgi:hypothetical protein
MLTADPLAEVRLPALSTPGPAAVLPIDRSLCRQSHLHHNFLSILGSLLLTKLPYAFGYLGITMRKRKMADAIEKKVIFYINN